MSESNVAVLGVEQVDAALVTAPESEPDGEQTAEQGAAEVAAAALADQAAAAEQEQAAREQAAGVLKALVVAFRKGERAYALGLLRAGELCWEYIGRRVALGDKRAAAVQSIEGQLAVYASDAVDINRLVRAWAGYAVLGKGTGLAKPAEGSKAQHGPADGVPYGHYRDGWCRLVEQGPDGFRLLPGIEADSLAAYTAAVTGSLSKAAVLEQCDKLVREQAKRQAAATELARQQHKAQVDATARAQGEAETRAQQAEVERLALEQASREELNAELRATAAEQLAEQTRVAEQALAAKLAADKAAKDAKDRQAELDRQARVAAEAEAKRAKAESDRAARQAAKSSRPATPAPAPTATGEQKPTGEPRLPSILAQLASTAKAAMPRDFATMLAQPVWRAEDPLAVIHELALAITNVPDTLPDLGGDDVALALLAGLKDSKQLSAKVVRALHAALAVLGTAAPVGPSPAQVANAINGQPAVA